MICRYPVFWDTEEMAPPLPGSFQVSWVILLANGRNLVPPVEGFRGFRRFKRLKAGKRQARMP